MSLVSPVTYQGGKGRLAAQIVEHMAVSREAVFYDFCCGSGAVSLELVARGHDPANIYMVDLGPWGMFWKAVGDGTFDLGRFRRVLDAIPTDPREIKQHVERMFLEEIDSDYLYKFLILQATAIGGAPVWIAGHRWRRSSGFRDYWLPTATSSRRSPVNPMMPMPDTIYTRMAEIVPRMRGVMGLHADANWSSVPAGSHVYIDPQYAGTTSYPYSIDAVAVAQKLGCPCWVSEGRALSSTAVLLSAGRAKGGITGDRKRAANEEWLSRFGAART